MSRYEREHHPADHVVHMSLDHSDKARSYSVARCDCGWQSRVVWPGHHDEQDAAVEAHWCAVEREKAALPTWSFGALKMFGYRLIVADPPWRFELHDEKTGSGKGAALQYGLMDLEAIKALRVGDLAAPDCLLLLWTTGWAIAEGQAQAVAKSWGFTPKSEIVWNKVTASGKARWGTGYRVRSLHEPILLCTLGNPKHKAFPSVFPGLAREHSRKPEEFYELVDRCAPDLAPRSDLFARTTRQGWDAWGNETDKFATDAGGRR